MARGRKRKANAKRTKTGRLSRPAADRLVKGNERAQAMQAIYGQDGADAIGRAYRAGLLGQGSDAKAMVDTARSIAKAYWAAYEVGPIRCTLAEDVSAGTYAEAPENARKREEWLWGCLDRVRALGCNHRRFFDALVIDVYPDHGPMWLDQLIGAKRCKRMPEPIGAIQAMEIALEGLAMIAGVNAPYVEKQKAA